MPKKRPSSTNSADWMRRMRARDRARGIIEVTVRVPAERAEELRAIAAAWLAAMPERTLPGQIPLFGPDNDPPHQ